MNRIAITGAAGYIGRFVTAELQRQGIAVRALARPQTDRTGFATPVEWISGDLRAPDAFAQLVAGVDAVVHLAYEHVPGKYRGGEGADLAAWLAANLDGSLRLLMAAQAAGVGRFIFLSSRAVFSRTEPGRALDEDHPTAPDTHYGAYKVAVEAFLKSFAMTTVAIRATGLYGLTHPVERSKWWGLIRAVVHDETITSAGGGTEVYGGDVARVIAALLAAPTLAFDTLHLSDLYVTHHEVVRLARGIAGKPGPLPPPPATPPSNILVSRHLPSLGIALGGATTLEATIADLVRHAQSTL